MLDKTTNITALNSIHANTGTDHNFKTNENLITDPITNDELAHQTVPKIPRPIINPKSKKQDSKIISKTPQKVLH